MNNVLIDKNYSPIHGSLENILKTLNQFECLRSAKNIIIKPNFAAGNQIDPNSHVVSDLNFILNLISFIKRINPYTNIRIAESDSTLYGFSFLKFQNLGISQLNIPGVSTLDLSRDILVKVNIPNARYFKNIDHQLWISKSLIESDFIISLANLKTHSITLFSGACKNLFGCLPNMNKEIYHIKLNDVIYDLVNAIRVNLSIVDGFFGLEENGPVQGLPVNLNFRVFSSSPICADIASCNAVGINFRKVKHLNLLYSSNPFPIDKEFHKEEIIRKILLPPLWVRFFNFLGLFIQSIGYIIYDLGNRIHNADSPLQFIFILIRPVLLRFFKIETLQKWKRIILKTN